MSLDKNSPTWRVVRDMVIRRIEEGRTKLEESHGSVELDQLQRGRIQAFREILALEKDPIEVKEGVTVY